MSQSAPDISVPDRPYRLSLEETAAKLQVDTLQGLSSTDAQARLVRFGTNTLTENSTTSGWTILASQLRSLIVALLIVAAFVSFAFGQAAEGFAVLIVIAINTAIGFVTELRATRSMEGLRQLARVTARVLRDGKSVLVDASDLVPGDVVVLDAGDVVPADLRLVTVAALSIDESVLTGESAPVEKQASALGGVRWSHLFGQSDGLSKVYSAV